MITCDLQSSTRVGVGCAPINARGKGYAIAHNAVIT